MSYKNEKESGLLYSAIPSNDVSANAVLSLNLSEGLVMLMPMEMRGNSGLILSWVQQMYQACLLPFKFTRNVNF